MGAEQQVLLLSNAGLFPEFNTLEAFAGQLLLNDFGVVLGRFAEDAKLEGTYFLCKQESVMRAARLLARVEDLSLQVCPLAICLDSKHGTLPHV